MTNVALPVRVIRVVSAMHEEQLEFLRAEGCDYVQGYQLGKPMPAHEVSKWISEFAVRKPLRKVAPTLVRAVS